MKRVFSYILCTLFLLIGYAQGISKENYGNKTIYGVVTYSQKDDKNPEKPPKGERTSSQSLPVWISMSKVEISGIGEGEIITYIINSMEGFTIGIYDRVDEFTDTLFSLSGDFEIEFHTSTGIYRGYVSME